MRNRWSSLVVFASHALCVGCLPAQLRHACIGRVVDAADAPIAAAEVTLAWSPGNGPGDVDVVHARSDERGYFHADLIVSHPYRVWATGPADARGECLVTEAEDDAAAGVVLELVALHRMAPRTLRCEGIEPWNGCGPPLVAWCPDLHSRCEIDLAAGADGAFRLPAGPWCLGAVALRTPDRELAGYAAVEPADSAPRARFAAPRMQHIQVTDAAGRPVDSAVIEQRCGGFWRQAGMTDGGGDCLARLIDDQSQKQWLCVVTGTAAAFVTAELPRDQRAVLGLRVPAMRGLRDVSAGTIRGARPGEVVAGVLRGTVEDASGRGTSSMAVQFPVRVEGNHLRFDRLTLPLADCSYLFHIVPRTEGTVRFALTAPRPAAAPPSVDLAAMHTLRIRAVDATNNPQPGARIAVFATQPSAFRPVPSPEWLMLDHAGRADLLLEGEDWAVYATNGNAHTAQTIGTSPTGELLLQLEPMRTMRLRIRDEAGRPVRGARLDHLPQLIADRGGRTGATARAMIAPLIAWPTAAAARSDRDGILTVPLQDWTQFQVWVQVHAGDLVSKPFPLTANRLDDITVESSSGVRR